MNKVNLLAIFLGLLTSNFGYQYFGAGDWREATHSSMANATALLCVFLMRKWGKP